MLARSLCVLSIALLTSCATGAGEDEDGLIVRGDARSDRGAEPDDTSTPTQEEDTGSTTDTAASGEDTYSPPADSGVPSEDTGPDDTGPTSCPSEEPEPNDTLSTARALGTINDCDTSGKTISGVLSSSSDIDILTFDGTDTFGCSVNPAVKATGPVTVCIQAECTTGTTELQSCPKGVVTSGQCCGTDVEAQINCTGTTTDSAKITITVRGDGSSLTCAAYSLAYHY